MTAAIAMVDTAGPDETRALGARIGRGLRAGDVLLLHGDLGAGKTTLTQGIAAGLGAVGPVQSPTFTLVGEHPAPGGMTLYHLDLYRLAGEEELESFGYDRFLDPADGVTVIEWPERAGGWLPERYLLIELTISGPDRRRITLVPAGEWPALDGVLGGSWADAAAGERGTGVPGRPHAARAN